MNRIGITAENSQDFFINGLANTNSSPLKHSRQISRELKLDELNYLGKLLKMQCDDGQGENLWRR